MAALLARTSFAYLPLSSPEAEGVPSAAIAAWIDACEREIDAVHGFVLLRHGKLIAEGYWHPFSVGETHTLYSHSKSFTSTAVGLLVDDGALRLDQPVVELFPDKLPPQPDARLKKMTVRDLLVMASGHGRDFIHDTCVAPDGDWLRFFFAQPLAYEPGSTFVYNTTATYVLGAVVEKVSGERLMDFLNRRLFRKLGISDAWTSVCPQGRACGGYGMNMCVRDLALFGELYLRKGLWNGERILSEGWIAEATGRRIEQGPHPMPDWGAGYGYQFWRCVPKNVYRADGALGQFTVVMPDQDAVLSFVGRAENTQRELELVWKHLLPAMRPTSLPDDPEAQASLARRCRDLVLKPVASSATCGVSGEDRTFFLEPNERDVAWIRLEKTDDGWRFLWKNRAGTQSVRLGNGAWAVGSKVTFDAAKAEALKTVVGERKAAGSGGWISANAFRGRIVCPDGVAFLDFTLTFAGETVVMKARLGLKEEYAYEVRGESRKASLPERWVFVQRNLQDDADFARATNTIATAWLHGYNAVAFLCGRDYCGEWLELTTPRKDAAFVARTCGPDRPQLMSSERRVRYSSVRAYCKSLGMRFAPLLWSAGYCSMQAFDPEMCAVFPVRDVPYVVCNGRAVFAGGEVQRLGDGELRLEAQDDGRGLVRETLSGSVKLKPWRRYRYSLEVKTEGLASQLKELQGLKIVFEDKHNRARDLHLRPLPLRPTQDWTVVTGAFNSEDVTEAVALVGIWGDKTGSGVFRNVIVEEVGLQCPVRRQGTPLVVRKAADDRVLAEGKDYAPPDHLKSLAFDGFETLDLVLSVDAAVKEGERLSVDAYEPATEYGIQFSTCLSHPGLRRYYEESARAIQDWISPDAWFLSADEFRVECRCELCRRRDTDMAHKYAATLWDQRNAIRRLAPDAEILFWSDMADENHNARDRYCKCVTTFRGLADLLPKDMVAVPWWTAKAQTSCDFFASRGFGVMPGAYYDKRTVEATQKDARDWCAALATTPTARGIMYTAWYECYDMLGVFARAADGACEPFRHVDVAVVGGGSAGFAAALHAARCGSSVLLVEQADRLGGTSTVGGVSNWEPVCGATGTPQELYERMRKKPEAVGVYVIDRHCAWDDPAKGVFPGGLCVVDPSASYGQTLRRHGPGMGDKEWFRENCRGVIFEPQALADTMQEMLDETGCCKVMLNTSFVSAKKDESGRVTELGLSDGTVVCPKVVIDACGAVCRAIGCKTLTSRRPNGATLVYRVACGTEGRTREECEAEPKCWWGSFPPVFASRLPNGDVALNMLPTMSGEEALSLEREAAYAECRRRVFAHWAWLKRRWPAFASWHVKEVCREVAYRETFRVEGEYVLTGSDVMNGVRPSDEIAVADHALDSHGGDGFGGELKAPYGIPYRCLLPKGTSNVLIAGRCASFDDRAASSCRLSRTMMKLGEAAGRAAHESISRGISLRACRPSAVTFEVGKPTCEFRENRSHVK